MVRILIMLLTISASVYCQEMVKYSPDFKFQDGIYLSFEDFKNNNPIKPTHVLTNLDIRSTDFIEQVLDFDTLTYYDGLYEERKTHIEDVWGFASRGKVHIGFNGKQKMEQEIEAGWYPLIFIGSYSYFTAVAKVSRFIPPTPGLMMQSRGTILDDGYMYPDEGRTYDERITVHLLLKVETGEVIRIANGELNAVHLHVMQELLQHDHVLYEEFQALTRKEQKHKSMFYIRRFNGRNPISFPVSYQDE